MGAPARAVAGLGGQVGKGLDQLGGVDVRQAEGADAGGVDDPAAERESQYLGAGGGVPAAAGDVVHHAGGAVGAGDEGVDERGLADAGMADQDAGGSRSRSTSAARSPSRRVDTASTPSGRYVDISGSGSARSVLVRHSSGSSPASNAATRQRSTRRERGSGFATATTMTS